MANNLQPSPETWLTCTVSSCWIVRRCRAASHPSSYPLSLNYRCQEELTCAAYYRVAETGCSMQLDRNHRRFAFPRLGNATWHRGSVDGTCRIVTILDQPAVRERYKRTSRYDVYLS
jgi:hypothetical protein